MLSVLTAEVARRAFWVVTLYVDPDVSDEYLYATSLFKVKIRTYKTTRCHNPE